MNTEELLNKYLDGELSAEELKSFEIAYAQDLIFKKQVDLYQDIIKGIQWSGIQKIREEVRMIHERIMPEMNKSTQFELDVTKALTLKNRQNIKEEIQNARNNTTKKTGRLIFLGSKTMMSIAASLIVIVGIAVFIFWNKSVSITTEGKDAMVKAYDLVRQEAQLAGVADPSKEINTHETRVFELLTQNKHKQATEEHEAFYQNHKKDYKYYQVLGWIYYQSGLWTQARSTFLRASTLGDPCMSKLLYAFLIPYSKQSMEIIAQVKEDAACKDSEPVNQLLKRIGK